MPGINGQDIPADGFGLFGLDEITVELDFGNRFGDAGLGDGLELVCHGTSRFVTSCPNLTIKEFCRQAHRA